jgi:S-adenosyl-L-methionine hydrolase (adenosine-forming)
MGAPTSVPTMACSRSSCAAEAPSKPPRSNGPDRLSASFHARDLFAPVAARLAADTLPARALRSAEIGRLLDWPDDLAEIVYIDGYGNAMTGLRAAILPEKTGFVVKGRLLTRARTFSDAPLSAAFWYENSNGLAEIAVNRGRADGALNLAIGTPISVVP